MYVTCIIYITGYICVSTCTYKNIYTYVSYNPYVYIEV